MPFGMSNTLASFQEFMNKILVDKFDIFLIIYLKDILIYTKNQGQDHIDAIC